MTSADLDGELTAAIRALSRADNGALAAAGIADEAIDAGLVGTARIRVISGDLMSRTLTEAPRSCLRYASTTT
jgi:hypothetical protein